ncbi:MAG: YkgJ family cysteine cluster protein [Asgard group archaeon]|nr:YkgJ family cysteine cluster protein [Asgard group archaeon]
MTKKSQRLLICAERCESKCCRSTPPALTSEDISRINKQISDDNWIRKIEESEKIVHIVEKKKESRDCYFLTERNLCSIYENRPLDCKLFPIFLKIKENKVGSYKIEWLVWYCPLTQEVSLETLLEEARKIIEDYLEKEPQIVFEYQTAMYESGGYKKKHFMKEEIITIN